MKQALLITGVFIATVIGAGFASGSEVVHYFIAYHNTCFWGILVSSLLFGVFAELLLSLEGASFEACMQQLMPAPFAKLTDLFSFFFMGIVFLTMLSGSGEIIAQTIGADRHIGIFFVCIICLIIFLFDLKGFLAANSILAIFIIVGMVGVCVFLLASGSLPASQTNSSRWLLASGNYVSYNLLTAAAVLVSLGNTQKPPRFLCGILSSITFFVILNLLRIVLMRSPDSVLASELPMLTLCKLQNPLLALFYAAVLFAAMLTTALSNGFTVVGRIPLPQKLSVCLLISVGYFGAGMNFSFLVNRIYRLAGDCGIVLFLLILIFYLKKYLKMQNSKKTNDI